MEQNKRRRGRGEVRREAGVLKKWVGEVETGAVCGEQEAAGSYGLTASGKPSRVSYLNLKTLSLTPPVVALP